MKLVPADHVTPEEQAMQQALSNYPELRERLMRHFHGYRELLNMCMTEMYAAHIDCADIQISMSKRDVALRCLGLLEE